jgi:hypothetical protein
MNKSTTQSVRPLIFIFSFVTAFALFGKSWLEKQGVDTTVMIAGNMILFLVSLFAFLLSNKSLRSSNPQAFVRAMYSSFIIKFFVLALAAFIYIMIEKKGVNKPALIVCAGLYILYTVFETRVLIQRLKSKKNA